MKRFMYLVAASLVTVAVAVTESGGQIPMSDETTSGCRGQHCHQQQLTGTWLFELRRGGQSPTDPPVLLLMSYQEDGTAVASAAVGSQTSHHGVWVAVGRRRFLQTMVLFNFNETRALTNIIKVRANLLLSADGQTVSGTQEVVIMTPGGTVVSTIPGGTFSGTRIIPEIPADFYTFPKQP